VSFIIDRRWLLAGAASAATAFSTSGLTAPATPFTLGVAAGDPLTDGFVIWTRLATRPLAEDGQGGMSAPVDVRWEVADDPGFRRVAQKGRATAHRALAHAVHVEVGGLNPGRPYWYRFAAQGHRSAVGKAATAPLRETRQAPVKLAVASCSHYEAGYFAAYRHMAAEQPDVVAFLGDYFYEYSYQGSTRAFVRPYDQPKEVKSLAQYRNRYAIHRRDPDLQALHAAAPCLMTWDDHEVQNDYAGRWSQNPNIPVDEFLLRRAAAYQAYYEHMPLRARSFPKGPDMRIYDRLRYGDLVEFTVLDGRQLRTHMQPCPLPETRRGHVAPTSCPDLVDPSRSMLGFEQERWLADGFRLADARWNVVCQDLLIAQLKQVGADGTVGHYTDGWDGYQATRSRMLTALAEARTRNPVFLAGDVHSFWANDLKADFNDPGSKTVATEFVGTSITSDNPPHERFQTLLPNNPHVKFMDARRHGYMALTIAPDRIDVRYQAISDRKDPKASVSTLARFVVEDGKTGVVAA
jgi:alkaline phosphatase D